MARICHRPDLDEPCAILFATLILKFIADGQFRVEGLNPLENTGLRSDLQWNQATLPLRPAAPDFGGLQSLRLSVLDGLDIQTPLYFDRSRLVVSLLERTPQSEELWFKADNCQRGRAVTKNGTR